eukprot:TRINITY_DN7818_c0_g1_i1.p1 TRINITY_DN7818_c0_g1~~TRINITY_DN7818_c0_g1_i1.p1  ORF type:complete len:234 (+),score=40.31 TRINITY_DN7818_c0_g1_i1:90-791(+)
MALVNVNALHLSVPNARLSAAAEASKVGSISSCRPCTLHGRSFQSHGQPSTKQQLQPAEFRRRCIEGSILLKRQRNAKESGMWRRQAAGARADATDKGEVVYFDGGPHVGDLVVNLVFGLSVLWLPLTLASVARAFFLRYRFTNKRVTVLSGLTGDDRKDFSYAVVKDVKCIPRFIGEWGDILIELSDGTKVDLSAVPKFREVVAYTLKRAEEEREGTSEDALAAAGKGFSKA